MAPRINCEDRVMDFSRIDTDLGIAELLKSRYELDERPAPREMTISFMTLS